MAATDRYELLARLGGGSFGEVFRALERATGRTVAVKVLHRQDGDSLNRFYREAVALYDQLGNEHVVSLLDHAGLNDEEPHLALEFCALGSLRSWVGAGRSVEDVSTALMHAARGLSGVHAAGGLHRDVKPENLLVAGAVGATGWRVKVADFGLAGFPDPVTGTMTFSACGTKGYIAPEVLGGLPFHPLADVYSLGIVGVELLVGSAQVRALPSIQLPARLRALLLSMVSAVPEKRPSATQVVASLEGILASLVEARRPAPIAPAVTTFPVSGRRAPGALDGIATVALTVGAGALAVAGLRALFDDRRRK